ncbi:MAG: alanine racemase [Minisyncoccia bacterium]
MKPTERKGLRTWIEIDKKAIKHNYEIFRSLISPKCKMMSVVKSNAYGHNLTEFSKELEKLGVEYLGVDSVVEALALRKEGIKIPILVLGYTLPEMLEIASEKDISITVSNFVMLSEIKKLNLNKRKIKIHIKADTGMSRHGFLENEVYKVLKEIKNNKNISVEGLFTHFAMSKNPAFPSYTNYQIEKFNKWKKAFKEAGFKPVCHASATSGTLLYNDAHFDMVRIGIGLYGIWPSKELQVICEKSFSLKPILSWKTIIAEVKKMPKGTKVGYDCTETLLRESKIAVIPVGYWHGYPRALSGIGKVLVNDKECKILGRVCMDIIIIDVTDVKNVKVGDEVTLIGKDKKSEISADYLSGLLDASTYEFLTRINPLIKRFYI